jgi:hypothetical protein
MPNEKGCDVEAPRLRATLFAFALLVALGAGSASAAPLLALDFDLLLPGVQSSASIAPGESLTVEIRISGVDAGAPLNAFELDLGFDPAVASATSAAIGSFLVPTVLAIENAIGPNDVGLAAATLGPGAAFGEGVLATVLFEGLAAGTSVLSLDDVILSSPFGAQIAGVTLQGGTLHVVPEPTTALLVGLGVAVLTFASRRARR